MIVSIAQPAYLPWLGYFDRIARSDVHVILDHVPISHGDFTNRNKIASSQGWSWLTVPVHSRGEHTGAPIASIGIDNRTNWREKHLRSLAHAYARSAHFADQRAHLDAFYAAEWTNLAELCIASARLLFAPLALENAKLVRSSGMHLTQKKSDLVLEICRNLGASTYLSGPLGRDYLELGAFAAAGIAVRFHDYAHPQYAQCWKGDFRAYMSALDLVCNAGPAAREIMMSGQPELAAR